jgi:hypothetical protein
LDVSYGVDDISGGYLLVDPSANVDLSVNGVDYPDISGVFDVPGLVRGDNSLNFLVSAYDGQTSQPYEVIVHVQTAKDFSGNSVVLYGQPVIFVGGVATSRVDISYAIRDISGSYVLLDASANVDISLNGLEYGRGVSSPFDVYGLLVGDNSLNLTVTAYDGQTKKVYPINVHVQTSVDFSGNRVVLYGKPVTFDVNGVALSRLDVSFGVSDICGGYLLVDPRANVDLSVNGMTVMVNTLPICTVLKSHFPVGSIRTCTRSPDWVVVTLCTGVAKSPTSIRLRNASGKRTLSNSTVRRVPCCRISATVWSDGNLRTIKPAP